MILERGKVYLLILHSGAAVFGRYIGEFKSCVAIHAGLFLHTTGGWFDKAAIKEVRGEWPAPMPGEGEFDWAHRVGLDFNEYGFICES